MSSVSGSARAARALLAAGVLAAARGAAGLGWSGAALSALQEDPATLAAAAGAAPRWPPDYAPQLQDNETFEYVVVGAGAGGCAAAARLAAAGASVLLLEAGGAPSVFTRIPGAAMALQGSAEDWHYRTRTNNRSCLAFEDDACIAARGRGLGGSTNINYMMYTRGARSGYDAWPPGWRWRDLAPYFLRAEGLRPEVLASYPPASRRYHNTSGPVNVEYFADPQNTWHGALLAALRGLGLPAAADVNGARPAGVSRVAGYVRGGERESAATAYLARGAAPTLRVARGALATRVLLDGRCAARGVRVRAGGRELSVRASREVLLSAGAVGTPQLLLLSGVGPRRHLEDVNVTVRLELPVGEGLTDHVMPLMLFPVEGGTAGDALGPAAAAARAPQLAEWLATRSGPLASDGLTDVTAFLNLDCYDFAARRLGSGPGCEEPTLQLIHAYVERGAVALGAAALRRALGLRADVVAQLAAASAERALLVVAPVLLQPESRGRVRLTSRDPLAPPEVFPNYFATERDAADAERAARLALQLGERLGAAPLRLRLAGCGEGEPGGWSRREAAYWRCYARHMTQSVQHAVGSAALGAVLDARLAVRGARGLRVADAAAAPRLPRGNTAALVLALGERAADLMLRDRDRQWGDRDRREQNQTDRDKNQTDRSHQDQNHTAQDQQDHNQTDQNQQDQNQNDQDQQDQNQTGQDQQDQNQQDQNQTDRNHQVQNQNQTDREQQDNDKQDQVQLVRDQQDCGLADCPDRI